MNDFREAVLLGDVQELFSRPVRVKEDLHDLYLRQIFLQDQFLLVSGCVTAAVIFDCDSGLNGSMVRVSPYSVIRAGVGEF